VLVSEYDVGDIKRIALDGSQSVVRERQYRSDRNRDRPTVPVRYGAQPHRPAVCSPSHPRPDQRLRLLAVSFPTALAADTLGNLYVANSGSGVDLASRSRWWRDSGCCPFSQSGGPSGLAFDPSGTLLFTDHATGSVYVTSRRLAPVDHFGLAPFAPTYLALDLPGTSTSMIP